MARLVVGPFNRVEGDLEVALEIADGAVRDAYVNSPLYRGFEQILLGKSPGDALVIAPRICGICSVAQSSAAAAALAQCMGLQAPENGQLAKNLILGVENVIDHLTHFYLFFMPDFARQAYAARRWFARAVERFKAVSGSASRAFLPARARFLNMMGIMAGKWPHTLAVQPGGSTRAVQQNEKLELAILLDELRRFVERVTLGGSLEEFAQLDSGEKLDDWIDRGSDFALFLEIARDVALDRLGRASDRFLSYGSFHLDQGPLFPPGIWDAGLRAVDLDAIREDVSHAWLAGLDEPCHPSVGITVPTLDKARAYSWCKAPRVDGKVVETGAFARQMVAGHPLVRSVFAERGANVTNRVIARLLEVALILPAMKTWLARIEPGKPFCAHASMPRDADGVGLTEAARGSLGHWLTVRDGRIASYQIIAPTTWNFSPRDRDGQPGALEQALVGTPVADGEETPVGVQHVVRSFDPCMVCTVH